MCNGVMGGENHESGLSLNLTFTKDPCRGVNEAVFLQVLDPLHGPIRPVPLLTTHSSVQSLTDLPEVYGQ